MRNSNLRDRFFIFLAALFGFAGAVGISVFAATTISTSITTDGSITATGNATITGDVYATSTIQATGNLIGYGDLLVGGTTTAVVTGFNLGGAAGTHADAYISGGLGVGNATTTDGAIEANADLVVYDDGWVKGGFGVGTAA